MYYLPHLSYIKFLFLSYSCNKRQIENNRFMFYIGTYNTYAFVVHIYEYLGRDVSHALELN